MLRAAAGELPHLSVNGDGTAVREYVPVADVAAACRWGLEHAVPVRRRPPANEPHTVLADSTRARHDLGWTSAHSSLDEILRDAWAAKRA